MKPDPYALDNTGLTDESISWHTAYAGYGRDRVEMKVEHVEVQDCRNIERELKTMIAMLTEERDAAVKDAEQMKKALLQFSECDLNEANCASFAVANKRIRNIAFAALAAAKESK